MSKWKIKQTAMAGCTVAALVALSVPAKADNLVVNGSFEDLGGSFINTSENYMSLAAGSTAIASWTVSTTTTNEIAWGKSPTSDGHQASDGIFFLDLTGFGASSPNGAIQQTLLGLTVGQRYIFSVDVVIDGILPVVTINGIAVDLTYGGTTVIGSDIWTHETGTFVATTVAPVIEVINSQAGQQITFIDNMVVSAVPEPASLSLFAFGIAAIWMRRRGT